MSETRFILCQDDFGNYEIRYDGEVFHFLWEVAPILNEQQSTIQSLKEENKQLKQQLLYDGDDVCDICKHEYLTPSGNYFIGKCEKGHEECSKEDIEYCEDFEFKGDDNGY